MKKGKTKNDSLISKSLEELQKLKVKYIESYDYVNAQKVDDVIKKKKNSNIIELHQDTTSAIDADIDKLYNEYHQNREKLEFEHKKQELKIRQAISDQFQEMQNRHVSELVVIEKEYALSCIREENRPIPEYNDLLAQSKQLAYNDDFVGAECLRKRAEEIQAEQLQSRRDVIDNQYSDMRSKALRKQKGELEMLKNKLNSELKRIASDFENQCNSNERTLKTTLVSYQQKVIAEITSQAKLNKDKLILKDKLNRHFKKKIESLHLTPPSDNSFSLYNQ